MKQLKQEIETAVTTEYARAADKFGMYNNSSHESYAVILEEFEEAKDEISATQEQISLFWGRVKCNKNSGAVIGQIDHLKLMRERAINAACELVQVAAMAEKALRTIEVKETSIQKEYVNG